MTGHCPLYSIPTLLFSSPSEHVPGPQADHSLSVIRWEYLVHGYPELTTPDAQPALVLCQARQRVEERLEVTLSGVAPSAGGPKRGIRTRARTPATADSSPKTPDGKTIDDKPTDGVVVSEGRFWGHTGNGDLNHQNIVSVMMVSEDSERPSDKRKMLLSITLKKKVPI